MFKRKCNEIIKEGNIAKIIIESPKYGHFEVLIDVEDIDKVQYYTWRVNKEAGGYFYIKTNTKRTDGKQGTLSLHRLIVNNPQDMLVDHINHNTLDNRKSNLRLVTNKQNQENVISCQSNNKTSGIRGVSWNKALGKWKVKIGHNGKHIHGGYFTNIQDAETKAIELRSKYFTHNLI